MEGEGGRGGGEGEGAVGGPGCSTERGKWTKRDCGEEWKRDRQTDRQILRERRREGRERRRESGDGRNGGKRD